MNSNVSSDKMYRIPLPGDSDGVLLTFPSPMTPEQWDFFMEILPFFRIGLVKQTPDVNAPRAGEHDG